MTDLMISYSRQDGEFVRRLHAALTGRGRDVWVDWEDIPISAAWWDSISDAIEATQAFVFVISPDSMGSPICNLEIDAARYHSKRLVPILLKTTDLKEAVDKIQRRTLSDDTRKVLGDREITDMVRDNWNAVARHNWISFAEGEDFEKNLNKLLQAIDTDLEYIKEHTRLLVRAAEWEERGYNNNLLLIGSEITEAEDWLHVSSSKEPPPAPLHSEYIVASRREEVVRQRRRMALVTTGLVVSLLLAVLAGGLAFLANNLRGEALNNANRAATNEADAVANAVTATIAQGEALIQADRAATNEANAVANAATATIAQGEALVQAEIAATNAAIANENAERANSLLWSSYAEQVLGDGDGALALSLALAAAGIDDPPALSRQTLARVAYAPGPRQRINTLAGAVNGVAFSPEGDIAALGTAIEGVLLYDFSQGEITTTLPEPSGLVTDLAFMPDDAQVFVSSFNTVFMVDAETGDVLWTAGHPSGALINTVAVSPDGTRAASGSQGGEVVVWDVVTGEVVYVLEGHADAVNSIDFNHNGALLASGSADDRAILWDVATGEPVATLREQSDIFTLAFSPTGLTLTTGTQLGAVSYWNVDTAERIRTFGENNDITHTLPVTSVSYGRAGNTVISGGEDGLVIVWSTGTGRNMRIFDTHEDAVTGVAFNPEGTSALSSSQDGIVYWWSIESDEVAQSFTGGHAAEILSATYAADGSQLLASSTDENRLVLWDAATGNEIQRFNRNEEHTGQINHAVFTPDGTRFITVAADGTALVWDIASETIVSTFDMTSDGEMLRVAIHPDGTLAATGDENGLLYLWDIETGALVHELSDGTGEVGHRRDILSLAFSPDGTQLLSGSEDRSMILWSVDSGEPLRTYDGQRGRVIAVGFDESGQQLYSATNSDTLFVWDKDNTLPMATYDVSVEGEERTVTAVDFAA
ncbi:MAG: TIR domain-containing protein, partial [Chloroflexota bacterium]